MLLWLWGLLWRFLKGHNRFKLTQWKESGILKGSDDSKHSFGLSQPLHWKCTQDSHTSSFSFMLAQVKYKLEMWNKDNYSMLTLFTKSFVCWVFWCCLAGCLFHFSIWVERYLLKIMIANSSRTEITRILTRTQKPSLYIRFYFAKLHLTMTVSISEQKKARNSNNKVLIAWCIRDRPGM